MSETTHPALEALRDIAKRMQRSAGGGSTTKSRESIRLRAKQAIPALEALLAERDGLLLQAAVLRDDLVDRQDRLASTVKERDDLRAALESLCEGTPHLGTVDNGPRYDAATKAWEQARAALAKGES